MYIERLTEEFEAEIKSLKARLVEATELLTDARHDGSEYAMPEVEWLTRYARFLQTADRP